MLQAILRLSLPDVPAPHLILDCIALNNAVALPLLLAQPGIDIHMRDPFGYGLLHVAASAGAVDVLSYLLQQQAKAQAQKPKGAANQKEEKGNSTGVDAHGGTFLHVAASSGQVAIVDQWGQQPLLRDAQDLAGMTPLHMACANGQIACVEALLRRGARLTCSDHRGMTPAHAATVYAPPPLGAMPLLRLLHQASSSDCSRNSNKNDDNDNDNDNNNAPLPMLQSRDDFGCTPMHYAARRGDTKAVEYLARVLRDYSVDVPSLRGETPLHWAVEADHFPAVLALLQQGASTSTPDNEGETALHLCRSVAVAEQLLLCEGNVNGPRSDGATPLWLAAARGNAPVAECFLRQGGGNIGMAGPDGSTAADRMPMLQVLLQEMTPLFKRGGDKSTSADGEDDLDDRDGPLIWRTPKWLPPQSLQQPATSLSKEEVLELGTLGLL